MRKIVAPVGMILVIYLGFVRQAEARESPAEMLFSDTHLEEIAQGIGYLKRVALDNIEKPFIPNTGDPRHIYSRHRAKIKWSIYPSTRSDGIVPFAVEVRGPYV